MSSDLFHRFKEVQERSGLTMKAFSDAIAVSENTLRTIWKRQSTPKGEILEATCQKWPEYTMWLMTGRERYKPMNNGLQTVLVSHAFEVIDCVDARFMDKVIVNPEHFSKLVFLQSTDNENDLGGLILIDDPKEQAIEGRIRCIGIETGNINFASRHGGKLALKVFRDWIQANAKSLLESSEIKLCDENVLVGLKKYGEIQEAFLSEVSQANNEFLLDSFSKWKAGKKDW